jgi:hypothetical protein
MPRSVVAGAILATLLGLPLVLTAAPASAAPLTDSQRATAALEYLLAAQRADGSIDGSLGETADFVIGTAAAGYDPATLYGCAGGTGAIGFLATASDGAAADAAKTGKAILAVVAAGGDPSGFAGRNLFARLTALYDASSGAYGDGSTFSQAFAILALEASGQTVPAAALTELLALQDSDGSWSYGTTPVAAGDGDTNSTAIALMALDAAGDHAADSTGLAYLHSQQLGDGGFPYQNASAWGPPVSDPDSDSIVLQALIAAGQDPEAVSWSQGSSTVLTHLRAGQETDGGYAYPGMAENGFTTSQVPAALVRAPYAAPVHWTAGQSLPTDVCPSPSPTAGAASSASPTAAPAASPSPTAAPAASPTATPTARPTVRPALKRTARPTARPTAIPTDEPVASPTSGPETPILTVTATPAATDVAAAAAATEVPTADVAGATSHGDALSPSAAGGSSDGLPTPLLYGMAALVALLTVAGGGWILMARPRGR